MSQVWADNFGGDEVEPVVPPDDFDESPSEDTLTLLHLGKLSSKITVAGHDIRLGTLKIGDELNVALLTKQWEGTTDINKAYATCLVAAAIITVNGMPLAESLGPRMSPLELLERKFNYVLASWYWPVIRVVYDEYLTLVKRQLEAIDDLTKK